MLQTKGWVFHVLNAKSWLYPVCFPKSSIMVKAHCFHNFHLKYHCWCSRFFYSIYSGTQCLEQCLLQYAAISLFSRTLERCFLPHRPMSSSHAISANANYFWWMFSNVQWIRSSCKLPTFPNLKMTSKLSLKKSLPSMISSGFGPIGSGPSSKSEPEPEPEDLYTNHATWNEDKWSSFMSWLQPKSHKTCLLNGWILRCFPFFSEKLPDQKQQETPKIWRIEQMYLEHLFNSQMLFLAIKNKAVPQILWETAVMYAPRGRGWGQDWTCPTRVLSVFHPRSAP